MFFEKLIVMYDIKCYLVYCVLCVIGEMVVDGVVGLVYLGGEYGGNVEFDEGSIGCVGGVVFG